MYKSLFYYNLSLKGMRSLSILFFACFIHAANVIAQDTDILYRVNGGGEVIEAEPIDWGADLTSNFNHGITKKGKPSPYLTLTNINEQDLAYGIASFTGTNTTGYPDQLFRTERFSKYRNKISQTWDFPVSTAGTYTINLLFAEIWEEAQEPGKRIFGISIEDSVVANSVDLVADPGWNIAVVKTYNIEVTDGNIDINFLRGIQNPAIKGIEIIGPVGANMNLPPRFDPLPEVKGEGGETINTTFTTLEEDGDDVTLALTVINQQGDTIDAAAYTFTDNGDGTANLTWATQETDIFFYNATITASDKDGSTSKNFTIIVSGKITDVLYRVNVGGGELADAIDTSRPPFSTDQLANPSPYLTGGGDTYKTSNPVAINPSVPAYVPIALFQTERFWPADSAQGMWAFEVPEGKIVSVRLFLSEIYLTTEGVNSNDNKGPRIFDIIINEDTVEKAVDIFAEVGENVGIMRAYSVTSNGAINISFSSISENPSIKGIEIIGVEPLIATVNPVDPICFGGNGSATVDVSGGIGPYDIIWEDGINPEQLLPGTYTVTIKDGSGQQKTEEFTINQPEAFTVTVETVNASAVDASDGKATATVTGGTEPYTYNWGDGVNPEALPSGNYVLTVTDANACTATEEFVIGDPDTLVANVKTINPTCFGGTGSAEVTATGGSSPYTITWAEGVDPTALVAGEYTVTVLDNAGKQIEKKVVITQPETALSIEVNTTDASAFGASDGSASLIVSGGTPPYNIFWGDISPNAIPAGTYTVMVKDAAGCEKDVEIVIGQPVELTAEIIKTDATCDTAGTATLNINGGTLPYEVIWSNNANPDSLSAGTYEVVITDANDVSITQEVEILLDCDEPVGTEDPKAEDEALKIYPVPGNGDGLIHVSVPPSLADKDGVLRIYTLYGQTVYQQKINTWNVGVVNVNTLSKGTYILEVNTNNKVLKRRFFVK